MSDGVIITFIICATIIGLVCIGQNRKNGGE